MSRRRRQPAGLRSRSRIVDALAPLGLLLILALIAVYRDRGQPAAPPLPPSSSESSAATLAPADTLTVTGRVTYVDDGDSFEMLTSQGGKVEIRLFGIDAPEGGQPHGRQAREALRRLILRSEVELVVVETDRYERLVGNLYCHGAWVNKAMVSQGWAWQYKHYSEDAAIAAAEREARRRKLGLWRGSNPIPPWDWRRREREAKR